MVQCKNPFASIAINVLRIWRILSNKYGEFIEQHRYGNERNRICMCPATPEWTGSPIRKQSRNYGSWHERKPQVSWRRVQLTIKRCKHRFLFILLSANKQWLLFSRFAKMWYKGVSFTSENCALVYLVDSAGTRTTTDNFSDLSQDFSLQVYYSESRHGMAFIADAISAIQAAQYWVTDEGVENWIINNVRISQAPDGLVR